VPNFTFIG